MNKTPGTVKVSLGTLANDLRPDGPGYVGGNLLDGVSEANISDVSIDPSDYQPKSGTRHNKSDSSNSVDNSETSSWKSVQRRIYNYCDR